MPTIYCYRKCTTCQKAMKWLEDRGIEYTFIDIKDDHPSEEKLRDLHAKSGLSLRRFFNTSGMLYREMELAKRLPQMSEDEMFALLATDGMLVKRPILINGSKVAVGFKEKEWEEVLGG